MSDLNPADVDTNDNLTVGVPQNPDKSILAVLHPLYDVVEDQIVVPLAFSSNSPGPILVVDAYM